MLLEAFLHVLVHFPGRPLDIPVVLKGVKGAVVADPLQIFLDFSNLHILKFLKKRLHFLIGHIKLLQQRLADGLQRRRLLLLPGGRQIPLHHIQIVHGDIIHLHFPNFLI